MRETENGGVESLSRKCLRRRSRALEGGTFSFSFQPAMLAIGLIAQDGRANVGHVNAYLVGAASFETAFHESSGRLCSGGVESSERLKRPVICDRQLSRERIVFAISKVV